MLQCGLSHLGAYLEYPTASSWLATEIYGPFQIETPNVTNRVTILQLTSWRSDSLKMQATPFQTVKANLQLFLYAEHMVTLRVTMLQLTKWLLEDANNHFQKVKTNLQLLFYTQLMVTLRAIMLLPNTQVPRVTMLQLFKLAAQRSSSKQSKKICSSLSIQIRWAPLRLPCYQQTELQPKQSKSNSQALSKQTHLIDSNCVSKVLPKVDATSTASVAIPSAPCLHSCHSPLATDTCLQCIREAVAKGLNQFCCAA